MAINTTDTPPYSSTSSCSSSALYSGEMSNGSHSQHYQQQSGAPRKVAKRTLTPGPQLPQWVLSSRAVNKRRT